MSLVRNDLPEPDAATMVVLCGVRVEQVDAHQHAGPRHEIQHGRAGPRPVADDRHELDRVAGRQRVVAFQEPHGPPVGGQGDGIDQQRKMDVGILFHRPADFPEVGQRLRHLGFAFVLVVGEDPDAQRHFDDAVAFHQGRVQDVGALLLVQNLRDEIRQRAKRLGVIAFRLRSSVDRSIALSGMKRFRLMKKLPWIPLMPVIGSPMMRRMFHKSIVSGSLPGDSILMRYGVFGGPDKQPDPVLCGFFQGL